MVGWALRLAAIAAFAWIIWSPVLAETNEDAWVAPLTLRLSLASGGSVCTAGAMTELQWIISGGEGPYRLHIDGRSVDLGEGYATVLCGSQLSDAPFWLTELDRNLTVTATVNDTEQRIQTAALQLTLREGLTPPQAIDISAGVEAGDRWQIGHPLVTVDLIINPHQLHRAGRSVPLHYLVRWREIEQLVWRYDARTTRPSQRTVQTRWSETDLTAGARYAIQFAQLRSQAEASTPQALRWSAPAYVNIPTDPQNLTARVTHDAIRLFWNPAIDGYRWRVTIQSLQGPGTPLQYIYHEVGPEAPYEIKFDDLTPDTPYTVKVIGTPGLNRRSPSIELRTEPAPGQWTRQAVLPQHVELSLEADQIVATWDPPSSRLERLYEVFFVEYGSPRRRGERVEVEPGIGTARSKVLPPGALYEVVVRHLGVAPAEVKRLIRVPPVVMSVVADRFTLPDWHVSASDTGLGSYDPEYEFKVGWEQRSWIERAQIEWRRDGFLMSRFGTGPSLFYYSTEPGPIPFRIRFQHVDGTWSQWSATRAVAVSPPTPEDVNIRERTGELLINWGYAGSKLVDGYRVYLRRDGEPQQMFDAGRQSVVIVPVEANSGTLHLLVGSYHEQLGEGDLVDVEFEFGQEPDLRLSEWRDAPVCDPAHALPARVFWHVRGGTAPFVLTDGKQELLRTPGSGGYVLLTCSAFDQNASDAGAKQTQEVTLTVTDARGNKDSVDVSFGIRRPPEGWVWDGSEPDWTRGIPAWLNDISVQSTAIWFSFRGPAERLVGSEMILRWRGLNTATWNYERFEIDIQNGPNEGLWKWDGLTPNVSYEVQVAKSPSGIATETLEGVEWSRLSTVRTLPSAVEAILERDGTRVTLTWPAIPDAWGYRIVLRGEGVNWQQEYAPNGTDSERAVFTNVPLDTSLEVEIETPPDHQLKPGFRFVPLPHD